MSSSTEERIAFSARLQEALTRSEYKTDSPTALAREFNIRFNGTPITVHAARKWLLGEAIPTQEKIRTLSQWLGVPADWMRFGGGTAADTAPMLPEAANVRLPPRDMAMVESIQRLPEEHREVIREMVRMMARLAAPVKASPVAPIVSGRDANATKSPRAA